MPELPLDKPAKTRAINAPATKVANDTVTDRLSVICDRTFPINTRLESLLARIRGHDDKDDVEESEPSDQQEFLTLISKNLSNTEKIIEELEALL